MSRLYLYYIFFILAAAWLIITPHVSAINEVPLQSEVGTTIATGTTQVSDLLITKDSTTSSTTTTEDPDEDSWWDNFLNWFRSFFTYFGVSVVNSGLTDTDKKTLLSDYGSDNNTDNQNHLGAGYKITSATEQTRLKNQYISEIVTGKYTDINLDTCPSDSSSVITSKKLAYYLMTQNKQDINFSEIQKEHLTKLFKDVSIGPSDYSCYDELYIQHPIIPKDQSGKSNEQIRYTLNQAIPSDSQNTPTKDSSTSSEILDRSTILSRFLNPDGKNFGFQILRPDKW